MSEIVYIIKNRALIGRINAVATFSGHGAFQVYIVAQHDFRIVDVPDIPGEGFCFIVSPS